MSERVGRRGLLLAALALQGCSAPLGPLPESTTTKEAQALLAASADAHGLAALSAMADVSVSYTGAWHGLVEKLQPALVDAGFRGSSQERLLLRDRVVAQAHTGPSGHKQVVRRTPPGTRGDVHVWFNGMESADAEARAAAALVVDGYSLFLLGPMLLASSWATDRSLVMERLAPAGGPHPCDVLRVSMRPGFGFSDADQLALFIDRDDRLMRRLRFTLNGLDGTRGAVAEVDTLDHLMLHGVRWPTRFQERLLRPFPLPVHDWVLTGLDVDRGLSVAEVSGPQFEGGAIAPAGREGLLF